MRSAQVSVGTSPVLVGPSDPRRIVRSALVIRNTDALISVFLGGADVTTTTGFELRPSTTLAFELFAPLYARTVSGTARLDLLYRT